MAQPQLISIDNGKTLHLDPRVFVKESETCLLFYGVQETPFLLPCNVDGSISMLSAQVLLNKGIATYEKSQIFSNADLCKAIFNWDFTIEIDHLLRIINSYKNPKVLDVGCGYGRLFIPLYNKGTNIFGIDNSLSLIQYLNNSLDDDLLMSRVFCTDIIHFIIPEGFEVAFSAMNTLRYLEDIVYIKQHLINMAYSVKKAGVYLVNIMLSPQAVQEYCHKWKFDYLGQSYFCEWRYDSYLYLTNKIIDKITITLDIPELQTKTLEEFQAQAYLSAFLLKKIIQELDVWEVSMVLDQNWNECEFSDELEGNHWIILKRK